MSSPQNEVVIIGIDCATELKKVGVAVARWSGKAIVEFQKPFHGDDSRIAESLAQYLARKHIAARDRVLLALDAPLGWPDAMRTELATHSAGRPLATGRQRMFSRVTDRFVRRRTGKTALDVGANLIAKTAHWALEFLEQLREVTREEIPLAWVPGEVRGVMAIEVYPAAERVVRDLHKADAADTLTHPNLSVANLQAHKDVLCASDHLLDAVLCVLAGAAFLNKTSMPIPSEHASASRREGWIWFSKDALQSSCGGSEDGT